MTKRAGAWLGLVSAGVALGVAHMVAAFVGGSSSPIVAVGSASIDRTPEWLKSFAIRTFGEQDKIVLLAGIGVVVTLLAIALGIASLRRPRTGLVGLAVLGAVGALAALTRPNATAADALPAVVGAAAGAFTLVRLQRRWTGAAPTPDEVGDDRDTHPLDAVGRRRFLIAGGVALGVAAAAGALGQFL
jgi:hypothetical protein